MGFQEPAWHPIQDSPFHLAGLPKFAQRSVCSPSPARKFGQPDMNG